MDSFIIGVRGYGLRIDGRTMNEYRNLNINLNRNYGEVEVNIGKTYVLCVIKTELVTPVSDRPSEGFISFSVDAGPLCLNPSSFIYRYNRGTIGIEIANYIERMLRETGAVDTEVLCIMSGICSWSVKCEIHILSDDGNLFDACLLAAVSGLRHYKYNGIDIDNFLRKFENQSLREKDYLRLQDTIKKMEMMPFNVHHFPLSVTIGYLKYKEELFYIVDPNSDEENVIETLLHIAVNERQEICGLTKFGGNKLTQNQLNFAIQLALIHSEKLHQDFKNAFNKESSRDSNSSRSKANILIDNVAVRDLETNLESDINLNNMNILIAEELKIFQKSESNEELKSRSSESSFILNDKNKDLGSLNTNEKTSPSDGICKTLEKVQLDQNGVNSMDLLSAVKTNFRLKKRKKG